MGKGITSANGTPINISKCAEAEKIPFQGAMISLMAEEKEDISWQSVIYRVPRGMMAWAVRAGTQCLATPDNLVRWGVQVDNKCPMGGCTARCTLGHILINRDKCLERYRYRHDSCLTYILSKLVKNKPKEMTVLADLPGWRENGGSVPHYLAVTGQMPDIVIVDKSVSPRKVVLLELTSPFDSAHGFEEARKRKVDRYERLALDIEEKGLSVWNCPLEVGCRGVISARNSSVLASLASMCKIKDFKNFRRTLGKIALLGSHLIWISRKSQTFVGGSFIQLKKHKSTCKGKKQVPHCKNGSSCRWYKANRCLFVHQERPNQQSNLNLGLSFPQQTLVFTVNVVSLKLPYMDTGFHLKSDFTNNFPTPDFPLLPCNTVQCSHLAGTRHVAQSDSFRLSLSGLTRLLLFTGHF